MKSFLSSFLKKAFPYIFFPAKLKPLIFNRLRPQVYMDDWSIQPFNGQIRRHGMIYRLIDEFKPTLCIETGTYLGSSTPYLAGYSMAPTYSIEIDRRNFLLSKERHQINFANIKIINIFGDSSYNLAKILETKSTTERVLAYLDAHWLHDLPTKSELQSLLTWGGEWIAIIDDFQVPGDSGYGFDDYGHIKVNIDLIPTSDELMVFVPAESSAIETGARRGTGYVVMKKSALRLNHQTLENLKRIR